MAVHRSLLISALRIGAEPIRVSHYSPAVTLTLALFALCSGCVGNRPGHHPSESRIYLAIGESSRAQQGAALAQVDRLNAALQGGTRYGPTHRYIALLTLDPTQAQIEVYLKRRAEAEATAAAKRRNLSRTWVDPSRLRCLMVWDTQSNTFVTRYCYLVGSLPDVETVSTFGDVTAEFVGPQ
jgi:hypothetical protein